MKHFQDHEKHNSPSETIPPKYYGWECVSLKLPSRTIDLVIKDEDQLAKFILSVNALIYLQLNGSPATWEILGQNDPNYERISTSMSGYRLIRAKMKISYMASIQKVSIIELFVTAMIKSFKELRV